MIRTEKYSVWAIIEIKHEFYNGTIPVSLIPSLETSVLLSKENIIFKKAAINQWILLKPDDPFFLLGKENVLLHFDLQVTSDDFYYASTINDIDVCYSLVDTNKPGVWKALVIQLNKGQNDVQQITLSINSKHKFFEYLIIPKYTTNEIQLKLTEDKNRVQFEKVEKRILFENVWGYSFVSTVPVQLKKNCDYKMRLWEIRKSGDKILSEHIPNPKVEDISIINPADTITSYYYF